MIRRIVLFSILFAVTLITNNAYGQVPIRFSAGASIGGTGMAGIPIQLKFGNIAAIDFGGYFRTAHVDEYEDLWCFGPAFDAGINLFLLKRENQDKNKVTAYGLYLKGAYGLNKKAEEDYTRLSERSASLGWLMEIDTKANPGRFFQFELGPSIIQHSENYLNTRYPPGEQLQNSERFMPMIYLRLGWFFILDQ